MISRRFLVVSVCGAGLSLTSLAMAQQAPTKNAQPQEKAGQTAKEGHRAHWMNSDQQLATCVAIANQEEIAIARFAEEKAHNAEVKEFAKMLVEEHQSFLQKLQRYAPDATKDNFLNETAQTTRDESREAAGAKVKVQPAVEKSAASSDDKAKGTIQQTAAVEVQAGHHLDFIQLHREIATECLRASKQELSKKDAKEFDECFIGHQIANHAAMRSKLVVFERHASGDLKQVFAAGLETTELHMKKAESLMKKLANSQSSVSQK